MERKKGKDHGKADAYHKRSEEVTKKAFKSVEKSVKPLTKGENKNRKIKVKAHYRMRG